MKPFFITSSGTHVGKTHVMTTLCWQLTEASKTVTALKPVISGYDPSDQTSDSALILRSVGLSPTPALMTAISPWQFSAPLAPNMAATKENKPPLELKVIVDFCRDHAELNNDYLLVEGVGGIMVPLNDCDTVLDWMRQLGWPVVMVVGSYLGTISHTLTAVEVLKNAGLNLHALVVNESPHSDVSIEETVETFEKFISRDVPIIKLPRCDKPEPWKHMPNIRWLVEDQ